MQRLGDASENRSKDFLTVNSVGFSTRGFVFVYGSWTNTIRLGLQRTGDPIGKPLEGHLRLCPLPSNFHPRILYCVGSEGTNTIRLGDAEDKVIHT